MSILPALSQKLLNGRAYNAFSEVTNGDSMMAVLSVDVMDNLGRGYMAHRRDGFSNEFFEKNFEVWTASIVWGFGATIVRNWIDRQAKNLEQAPLIVKKLFNTFGIRNIQSDTLNPDVFRAQRKGRANLQQLTLNGINQYEQKQHEYLQKALQHNTTKLSEATQTLKQTTEYWRSFFDSRGNLIKKLPGRYTQHVRKEGMKIGLAFALPSAIIGLVVPTIYQSVTRRSIQHEKQERYVNLSHQFEHQPILAHPPVAGKQPFQHQLVENHTLGRTPSSTEPPHQKVSTGQRPVFGSLGGMVKSAIERVRESPAMNTLLIDGVISGGRFYIARNIYERLEVVAQELGLIFFAFFARTKIQHFFENLFDRSAKTVSKFQLPAIKWMNDAATDNIKGFQSLLSEFKSRFVGADNIAKNGFDFEQSAKYKWHTEGKEAITNLRALEQALIGNGTLKDYLLQHSEQKNILFELAKTNGDIGMHTVSEYVNWTDETASQIKQDKLAQFAKARATNIDGLQQYLANKNLGDLSTSDRKWIQRANIPVHTTELYDAAQEINTKGLHQTGRKLAKTIHLIEKHFKVKDIADLSKTQLEQLQKLMQKSTGTKFFAWLFSILISTAFVGWIIPRSKQLITYAMTGKDTFPGRFNDGKRQNILSTQHHHYQPVYFQGTPA